MEKRCYFDKDLVCIGTIDHFGGDYYVSEYCWLDSEYSPIGRTFREIETDNYDAHGVWLYKMLDNISKST